jgi:hypothetical protein
VGKEKKGQSPFHFYKARNSRKLKTDESRRNLKKIGWENF